MVKNLKIFFCTSLDAQKSLLFPMSRRFCRQFLPHQILAVWQNAVPVSCDRAPAGGFLVRRLQVFFTGSKGRTVKARVAARRGSLDRLPASASLRESWMEKWEIGQLIMNYCSCTRGLPKALTTSSASRPATRFPIASSILSRRAVALLAIKCGKSSVRSNEALIK